MAEQICRVDFTEERTTDQAAERITELFYAKGYASSLAAGQDALALPAIIDDREALSGSAAKLRTTRIRKIAPETYEIAPEWSTRLKPLGIQGFRGSTMGGTTKQNHSFSTVSITPGAGVTNAPNFNGAVGVQYTSSGLEIVGVDVDVPGLTFAVDVDYEPGTIDFAFVANLVAHGKQVNNAAWNGFAAGEVKFLGADFSSVAAEQRESVTYNFEASPNATNLVVAGITVPSKLGWDYVWVLFEPSTSNNRLGSRAVAAYCERMARFRSFSGLGV